VRRWHTDGRIEADTRYAPIVRWLALAGWFRLARLAQWMHL
jgi:hypothetical protein